MNKIIEWLKTAEGENWTRYNIEPVDRWTECTNRRGAFADIEPISELSGLSHQYSPEPEATLKIESDWGGILYEPEKLPAGLSCPA